MTETHWDARSSRCLAQHRALATLAGVVGLSLVGTRIANAAPTPPPVSSADYGHVVARYHHAVASGTRMSPAIARGFEDRFASAKIVIATDGARISPDNSAEIAAMDRIADTPNGSEPDENTRSRAAVLDRLVNPGTDLVSLRGDAGVTARQILNTSEFDYHKANLPKPKLDWLHRWLDHLGDAIARWLDHLFGGAHPDGPKAPSLSGLAAFVRFFFIALLIIAGAAAAAFLGLKLYQNRDRFRRRTSPVSETGLDLGPDEIGDPIAAAHRLADRGDFRGAIRLAYIASLRTLAESGAITIIAYRTNWEYQRELSTKAATKSAIFRPATALFDRVWYGHRNGTPAEFTQIIAIYENIAGVGGASAENADNDGRLVGTAQDGR